MKLTDFRGALPAPPPDLSTAIDTCLECVEAEIVDEFEQDNDDLCVAVGHMERMLFLLKAVQHLCPNMDPGMDAEITDQVSAAEDFLTALIESEE